MQRVWAFLSNPERRKTLGRLGGALVLVVIGLWAACTHASELVDLDREAEALFRQGAESGDNAALAEAIDRYRALLDRRSRAAVPLDWARTQNDLGVALWTLGARTQRRETLVEARAAMAGAFEAFMAAGDEHRRAAFEAWLVKADATIARMERR